MEALADRQTTIDESVAGFDEIASQMVHELDIVYPKTIRSTPVPGTYVVDGNDIVNFSMNSMIRLALDIERQEQERFQSVGLRTLAGGFAIQFIATVLRLVIR